MALSSLGSLGFLCSLRLDMEDDFPRLKKDRQLPTGDFLALTGGLFLGAGRETVGLDIRLLKHDPWVHYILGTLQRRFKTMTFFFPETDSRHYRQI